MEKITKTIRCTVSIGIDQYMTLTESQWKELDEYLETHDDIDAYEKVNGEYESNDLYDLVYDNIDIEGGDFSCLEGVEIED
jgi:hypothetical protein